MPFKSKAQEKAAFSGALGPEMKKAAPEWASKTPKKLPEHVSKKRSTSDGYMTRAFKEGKTSGNYSTPEQMKAKEAEYRKAADERPSKYKRIIK